MSASTLEYDGDEVALEIPSFLPSDFISVCVKAAENLNDKNAGNLVYLLAKALAASEVSQLKVDSISFKLLHLMLLSVVQRDLNDLAVASAELYEELEIIEWNNQAFLPGLNEILFPSKRVKFEIVNQDEGAVFVLQCNEGESVANTSPVKEEKQLWCDGKEEQGDEIEHEGDCNTELDFSDTLAAATAITFHDVGVTGEIKQEVLEQMNQALTKIEQCEDESLFTCSKCEFGASNEAELYMHIKTVHEKWDPDSRPPVKKRCKNSVVTWKTPPVDNSKLLTVLVGDAETNVKEINTEQLKDTLVSDVTDKDTTVRGLKDLIDDDVGSKHTDIEDLSEVNVSDEGGEDSFGDDSRDVAADDDAMDEDVGPRRQKRGTSLRCRSCLRMFETLEEKEKHVAQKGCYPCDYCGQTFVRMRDCKLHLKVEHNKVESYTCSVCKKSFDETEREEHRKACKSYYYILRCRVCNRRFSSITEKDEHQHTCEISRCKTCDKPFSSFKLYRDHMREEHQTWLCGYCGEEFESAVQMRRHNRLKHWNSTRRAPSNESSGMVCDQCGRVYAGINQLKIHIRDVHRKPAKMYPCEKCGREFGNRTRLMRHDRVVHLKERHVCPVCGKEFSVSFSLSEHLAKHDGIERFKCDICGEGFVHRASFKRHVVKHMGEKLFTCSMCQRSFDNPEYLKAHVKRNHRGFMAVVENYEAPGSNLKAELRNELYKVRAVGNNPNHTDFTVRNANFNVKIVPDPSVDLTKQPVVIRPPRIKKPRTTIKTSLSAVVPEPMQYTMLPSETLPNAEMIEQQGGHVEEPGVQLVMVHEDSSVYYVPVQIENAQELDGTTIDLKDVSELIDE